MGSILHHIMLLIINSFGGGDTHTHTHTHTHTYTHTHTHIHTHTHTHTQTCIPTFVDKAILRIQARTCFKHWTVLEFYCGLSVRWKKVDSKTTLPMYFSLNTTYSTKPLYKSITMFSLYYKVLVKKIIHANPYTIIILHCLTSWQ